MEEIQGVILSKSADWDAWLFHVKAEAVSLGIWELIDPTTNELRAREIARPNPPESLPGGVADAARDEQDSDLAAYHKHLAKWQIYQIHAEQYQSQQRTLRAMTEYIVGHVSPYWSSYLVHRVKERHHPRDMVRILQDKVAPTPAERILLLREESDHYVYGAVPDKEHVLEWLEKWDLVIAKAPESYTREWIWAFHLNARLGIFDKEWSEQNKACTDVQELLDTFRRHWKEKDR